MKKSIGAKTIVHPHPVLIVASYDQNLKANMMAVSWGGICCSNPPCVALAIRKETLTYHNIIEKKAFTVGVPSIDHVKEADYVGLISGKEVDKFKMTGLTPIKSEKVEAPIVDEFPYSLECQLIKTVEIGSHTQFIGEILDIKAQEEIVTKRGWVDIEQVRPFFYGGFGNRSYYGVGDDLGKAFSVGKAIN